MFHYGSVFSASEESLLGLVKWVSITLVLNMQKRHGMIALLFSFTPQDDCGDGGEMCSGVGWRNERAAEREEKPEGWEKQRGGGGD